MMLVLVTSDNFIQLFIGSDYALIFSFLSGLLG